MYNNHRTTTVPGLIKEFLLSPQAIPSAVLTDWVAKLPGPEVQDLNLGDWNPQGAAAMSVARHSWQHAYLVAEHTTDPKVLEQLATNRSLTVKRAAGINPAATTETVRTLHRWLYDHDDKDTAVIGQRLPFPERVKFVLEHDMPFYDAETTLNANIEPGSVTPDMVVDTVFRLAEHANLQMVRRAFPVVLSAFLDEHAHQPDEIVEVLERIKASVHKLDAAYLAAHGNQRTFSAVVCERASLSVTAINDATTRLHRLLVADYPTAYADFTRKWASHPPLWKMPITSFGTFAELDRFVTEAPTFGAMLSMSKMFPKERLDAVIDSPDTTPGVLFSIYDTHENDLTVAQLRRIQDRFESLSTSLPFLKGHKLADRDLLIRTVVKATHLDLVHWVLRQCENLPKPGDIAAVVGAWLGANLGRYDNAATLIRILARMPLTAEQVNELIIGMGTQWRLAADLTQHDKTRPRSGFGLVAERINDRIGDNIGAWSQVLAMLVSNTTVDLPTVIETAALVSRVPRAHEEATEDTEDTDEPSSGDLAECLVSAQASFMF